MRSLLLALAVLLGAASAASLEDAAALYASGRLPEAAASAASLNSPAGFTLAARATNLLAGTLPRSEQEGTYRKAHTFASKAIELDPRQAGPYLERARATGRLALLSGPLAALASGAAKSARDDLETALKLDRARPDAMVGIAAWHAQVAASGGGFLYGADASKVQPLFEQAIKAQPKVISYRVEYAVALRALGKKDPARAQLAAALALVPSDYAEKLELERAKALQAEWGGKG